MWHCTRIPLDVNPQVAAAVDQLGILLDDYHYSAHARARILAWTTREGTPTGCPELDREDEADVEQVFVEALAEVPFEAAAWDREDVCLDATMLVAGLHPLPFGDGPDAPEADPAMAFPLIRPLAERIAVPPVCGGGAAYEPTAEDLADFADWAEEWRRRRDTEDYLARFNDVRDDASERPC